MVLLTLLPVLLLLAPEPGDLPLVTVTADNTVLDRPCRIAIAPGAIITDADGNGVLHVAFDDGVVQFEPGSVVRGSPAAADPDTFSGTGIRIDGRRGVTIRGARLEGFNVGLHATRAPGLTLDSSAFDDNFRQRLKSTPQAEDSSDWLWPHNNDSGQWRTSYGAAACIEDSDRVTVRNCTARRGQNGLILDRVTHAQIYDNDFSFLSGWGIAMWRSCDNLISRNALDFCIRGYSHAVYNRGQDSAGILAFEQCSRNTFIENSATHGGDGFFGFAGKEALGEHPAPQPSFDYTGRGNSRNVFVENDFSYAAAHGLELTFSTGNVIARNTFTENAICGIWGGYSSNTTITDNTFTRNGSAGYGLERGGINIEHGSRNLIASNTFEANACGIHLWWDEDPGIAKLPWAAANSVASADNWLQDNTFRADTTAVHLRRTQRTTIRNHAYAQCTTDLDADADSDIAASDKPRPIAAPAPQARGDTRPVGARSHLAGRHNIIMTQWGPWDHQSPLVRQVADDGFQQRFDLFKLPDGDLAIDVVEGTPSVIARAQLPAPGEPHTVSVTALSTRPGVHPFALRVAVGAFDHTLRGTLINCRWDVTFFPSEIDPRENPDAWLAASTGPRAISCELNRLRLPFGNAGPSQLKLADLPENVRAANLPRDHFGTLARTVIPLQPGAWRITALSDDGIRVRIRTGNLAGGESPPRTVIDNWTWHAPTRNTGEFTIPGPKAPAAPDRDHAAPDRDRAAPGDDPAADAALAAMMLVPVEIEVHHFELDGYATLDVTLERVP